MARSGKMAALPGFYYDVEKNRYFPIKGPIPGSNRASSSSSASCSKSDQKLEPAINNISGRTTARTSKLLQDRELFGNVIYSNKEKWNFREEYCKRQASQPLVWEYKEPDRRGDCALEFILVNKQTPNGLVERAALLTGSSYNTEGYNERCNLSLLEVGNAGQQFEYAKECIPDLVWPLNIETQRKSSSTPERVWRTNAHSMGMPSTISSLKARRKHSSNAADDVSASEKVLITTLGSDTATGSVHILDISSSSQFNADSLLCIRVCEVASFKCTIWTADFSSNGRHAVIGTNKGARLIDLETGASSCVFRSASDVLSQQFDQSGNLVLCGLRNGAIITIDVRQKQGGSSGPTRHRVPYPPKICEPSRSSNQSSSKDFFVFHGDVDNSGAIFMPSSVSCLVYLQCRDQYFLASSMDGSIKLYDHRMTQRGAMQSYEGHVNSHSRIPLGVDPSERFVMSGGADCKMRIWSIKSGELLFENKFSESVPLTMCCPRNEKQSSSNSWEAWVGSQEGLFRMQWP